MNVVDKFRAVARQIPTTPALITGPPEKAARISFAELDDESARLAALLRHRGLQPGQTVLVFQPVGIKLYVVVLAVLRLGATVMFVDISAGRSLLRTACRVVAPQGFVGPPKAHMLRTFSPELFGVAIAVSTGGWVPFAVRASAARTFEPLAEPHSRAGSDTALITFTSGSTGRPKGVARNHGFLLAQGKAITEQTRPRLGETELVSLPVFVLANLGAGITSVIPWGGETNPEDVKGPDAFRQIGAFGVERLLGPPALCERIAFEAERQGAALTTVRKVFTGGGPVFPQLMQRLQRIMPNAEIHALYGSSEAEPIAAVSLDEICDEDLAAIGDGRGLLAGKPVPGVRVVILPDRPGHVTYTMDPVQLDEIALGPNEVGEIVVTGPNVVRSYIDSTQNAGTKIRCGDDVWHRTGDCGHLDDRGRLWLAGRCLAGSGDAAARIYPFMVEAPAMALPGVARAAYGQVGDETLLVLEKKKEGAAPSPDDVRRRFGWARIDRVIVVPRIPTDRRHHSKVDYVALRKMLGRHGH